MHKVIWQGNAALIAGILVLVMAASLLRLLLLYIDAPMVWIVLMAWVVLSLMPFAIRLFSILLLPSRRGIGGIS